jgi:serine protease AprX
MATRRITAYFAGQAAADRAALLMRVEQRTETTLTGDAEDRAIEVFRERFSARVRVFEPPAQRAASLLSRDDRSLARSGPGDYVIETIGPLTDTREDELAERDTVVLEALGPSRALVRLGDRDPSALRRVSWIVSVLPATAGRTLALLGSELRPREPLPQTLYEIAIREGFDSELVRRAVEDIGGEVYAVTTRKVRAVLDDEQARRVVDVRGVLLVERYVAPRVNNDRARTLGTVDRPSSKASVELDGASQRVGIADTGVNLEHAALGHAIQKSLVFERVHKGPDDDDDPDGHGTHVAGTIVGSGTDSKKNALRGMAPRATLVVHALAGEGKNLQGLPDDLRALFEQAYAAGARVHNNSWASDVRGAYTHASREVDEFVAENRDMLIVFASGNDERDIARSGDKKWKRETASVGAPGTAKNALTVGAHRSDRTTGGWADKRYGTTWKKRFRPPTSTQTISGDREELAAFSGRGPADGERVKPELVAVGTTVASTSFVEVWRRQVGYETPGPSDSRGYGFKSGTSMAAPVVTGAAVLVRQYYVDLRKHDAPSAALLKATLINGARPLHGTSARDRSGALHIPNERQGFGALDLDRSIPLEGPRKLAFRDDWRSESEWLRRSETHDWTLDVLEEDTELLLALVHTDPPGKGLVHGLTFQALTDGAIVAVGNEQARASMNAPDHKNNAQVIRIPRARGRYVLRVAFEKGPTSARQDYALVAVGHLASDQLQRKRSSR